MAKAMMMFVPSYPIAEETEPIVFACADKRKIAA
jgi:hypothetical protein